MIENIIYVLVIFFKYYINSENYGKFSKSSNVFFIITSIFSFYQHNLMKAFFSIILLIISNTFMTYAWYGHLKFKEMKGFNNLSLFLIILISWGIAFFEYIFQVPANRIGYQNYGGPFSLVQLKVIQEAVSLTVFSVFTFMVFKNETIKTNQIIGFALLILAVYFIFKK